MKVISSVFRNTLILVTVLAMSFMYLGCDAGGGSSGGCNPPETTYDTYNTGAYETTVTFNTGPGGASGLSYPSGNGPYPIFLFACGGAMTPRMYEQHLNHIASWGIVMVAQISTGTGTELINALEWLTTENANPSSVIYQKLDLSKVAAGGHSLGSVSTFKIADDPRLTTTINIAGGSLDGEGGNAANLRNPTAYICAAIDEFGATKNAEIDYEKTTVPVFMTVMQAGEHITAPKNGLPAITAWLLWHLKGETQRQDDFLNANGEFQTGMWESKAKNW